MRFKFLTKKDNGNVISCTQNLSLKSLKKMQMYPKNTSFSSRFIYLLDKLALIFSFSE